MDQDPASPEQGLERYRAYLGLLVRHRLAERFQGKIDASGVVQQTLWEAHQGWKDLRGTSAAEVAAWLRRILVRNLTDEVRKLTAGKRDLDRGRSIEQALEQSAANLAWLAQQQASPSQQAVRHEQVLELAAALAQLPEDQRTAVERHHLEGHSLAEVGQQMQRSKEAVAGLLFRGLKRLRQLLPPGGE